MGSSTPLQRRISSLGGGFFKPNPCVVILRTFSVSTLQILHARSWHLAPATRDHQRACGVEHRRDARQWVGKSPPTAGQAGGDDEPSPGSKQRPKKSCVGVQLGHGICRATLTARQVSPRRSSPPWRERRKPPRERCTGDSEPRSVVMSATVWCRRSHGRGGNRAGTGQGRGTRAPAARVSRGGRPAPSDRSTRNAEQPSSSLCTRRNHREGGVMGRSRSRTRN